MTDYHEPLWLQQKRENKEQWKKAGWAVLRGVVMFGILLAVAYLLGVPV